MAINCRICSTASASLRTASTLDCCQPVNLVLVVQSIQQTVEHDFLRHLSACSAEAL